MRQRGMPSSSRTAAAPSPTMSAVKAVYQNICCATPPWAGMGPDSEKVMPAAAGGA